jgi:S-adenosyl-L-methionine hydrolase (adenosine-forming)
MPVVTLLTDFGLRDGYVGVMKGVIWKICPDAQIADITHFIPPQNIRQGAVALLRTVKYFPKGSVHIAVVDPGVGTSRKPLAAWVDGHFFVGPDNGLFSLIFQDAQSRSAACRFVTLDQPQYWLPSISRVFHGRDIFSPAGAHLANGVPLESMGSPLDHPALLENPQPVQQGETWVGEIVSIDNFGNLSTNITTKHLAGKTVLAVEAGNESINGLASTFGDRPVGELTAMIGTEDDLIIAVVQGNAAERLHIKPGDTVRVLMITEKNS